MKRILNSLCVFVILLSCSSNDDTQGQQQDPPSFYALKVGNSWVYKSQKYNLSTQEYEDTEIIDSVSVIGTEDILGNTYYKLRTFTTGNDAGSSLSNPNGEKFEFFREVEGNLINETNDIVFTTTDFSEQIIVEESWGTIYDKLAEELSSVTVPAGTFQCYNKQRYARTPEGDPLPSMDNFYYAEGIGLISDSTSFLSLAVPVVIRRLESYNVQ